MEGNILVVDDDRSIRDSMELFLAHLGLDARSSASGPEALALMEHWLPDIIITDLRMPGMDGLDLLDSVKSSHPWLPVVIVTAFDDMEPTIEAIRRGAYDFLEKPIETEKLRSVIENAFAQRQISRSARSVPSEEQQPANGVKLHGNTPAMRRIFKQIGQVSDNRVTVLVQGESGTGKELVARVIHESGVTKGHPFVAVNCAVLSEGLLESELFGHVRGSFTSAVRDKRGKFELAGEGTILLDEIADISPAFQAKLLRVLQEHEYEYVGGERAHRLHARIIAATNKDLGRLVQEGMFREDLFFRLNVVRIDLPPLRERRADIPQLVMYFLQKINAELKKNVYKVPFEVIEELRRREWPGNVRELENVLMQAIIATKGDVLELPALNDVPHSSRAEGREKGIVLESLKDVEKRHIARVLQALAWDKQKACAVLGISRPTLNAKIREYSL